MMEEKRIANAMVAVVAVFATLFSGVMWNEYLRSQSAEGIAEYPFGNEEAIAIGGEHYRSQAQYARTVLVAAVAYGLSAILIWTGVFSKWRWLAPFGAILGLVFWLASSFNLI